MIPSVSKDFSAFIYRVKHTKKNTDTSNSLQGAGTCNIVSNYVTVGGVGDGGELGAHSISVRIKYTINRQTGELVLKFSLHTNYYK